MSTKKPTKGRQGVNLPKGAEASQSGYAKPRRVWSARCSACEGTGFVRGLRGWLPCERCR